MHLFGGGGGGGTGGGAAAAAVALLISAIVTAALSVDHHNGTHSNATLGVGNAAPPGVVVLRDTAIDMGRPRGEPEFLTSEQRTNKFLYYRMYHKDDEYARWADNPDLGRGKYWSRAFRLTLYKNPNRVIADRGVGLGKAWMSDKHGFIRERSDVIAKLPVALRQKYGFAPRHNRRLPPRSDRKGDPTMTADPPPPMPTKRPAPKPPSEDLLKIIQAIVRQGNASVASNLPETVTINGVPLAVVGTKSSGVPSPSTITTTSLPLSFITISGLPLAVVSTVTSSDIAIVTVTTTASAAAPTTPSLTALAARVHARDLSQELPKRQSPVILPELEHGFSAAFRQTLLARIVLERLSANVNADVLSVGQAIDVLDFFDNQFTFHGGDTAWQHTVEQTMLEGGDYVLPEDMGPLSLGSPAIAESANVADGAVVEGGVTIAEGATIADGATIAEGAVIGKGATIAEGAIIGKGATIAEGVVVSKGATIAEGALVGEGITVAEGATFEAEAAGAAVAGGTALGAEGLAAAEGTALGAEGAALAAGEAAAMGATEGAIDAAIIGTEVIALAPLQEFLVVGQIITGVVLLVTIIASLLMALLGKKKHVKNPGGKLEWAWDWDGRPYQVDGLHHYIQQGLRPTPPPPPPLGCDTFDLPSLKDRGWTTTQYAMHPCPTWIPEECTREWYNSFRKDPHKGGDTVKGGNKNSRHNPNYCFEFWGFTPDTRKRFRDDDPGGAYAEALGHSYVADFAQYSGHELALREQCLGGGRHGKERLQHNKRCKKKFMPLMKHHNLQTEHCPPELCELQADKWRYLTTGWPKDCHGKKGNDGRCWGLWGTLGNEEKRSAADRDHGLANSSMEATPTV